MGKATTFTYDGFGRRQSIVSTPAGGGASTDRRLLWCGTEICQSRAPNGSVLREYLAEGENLIGGQKLFYGMDHQGSVRRAFNTTSSPPYDYDPYGQQIQSGTPVTDFTYAGLMALPESGLYLSSTRAYNPGVGRWLRRDMAGESSDTDANLYAYSNNDPVNLIDPDGEAASPTLQGAALGGMIGLGTTWWDGVKDGDYTFCEFGQTIRAGVIGAGIDGATGAGFAAALKGSARIAAYVGRAAERAGTIRTVNAVGGGMNCVNCVIATDATLAGRPASALGGGPFRLNVLERLYGTKFGPATTIDNISSIMADAGPGSRGIVFGSRGSEVGHVFNVANQKGIVRFLDGQTGKAATFDGFNNFRLLRTNK